MTFQESLELLDRDEAFKATVATMNTLLIQKGIYTQEEYEAYFIETAKARLRKQSKVGSNGASPVHR